MAKEPSVYGKSIRRIVVLQPNAGGQREPVVIYEKRPQGKRKTSRSLRSLEGIVRVASEAQQEAATTYVERHRRSNERKRDGWLRDLGKNVLRATRAARDRFREAEDDEE